MTQPTIELKPSASPLSDAEREAILANPGFGRHFTDHMVTIKWTEGRGWHDGQLVPYGPLSLDPANMTLHYAQEIFEGLKAYRQADGSVATFRPDKNAKRFQASARRLGMPELPVETFIEACDVLVQQDRDWVPAHGGEESLYLRPFMIATEVGLGVKPANEYLFLVIASSVAPTSRAASSPSPSGSPRTTSAPCPAAWATPRPAATTPRRCSPRPRPPPRAAPRSATWTPSSASGSRNSAV